MNLLSKGKKTGDSRARGIAPRVILCFHADLPRHTSARRYTQLRILYYVSSYILLLLLYINYTFILRCAARLFPARRRIGLKLWTSLDDNVFKERKVLYILYGRGGGAGTIYIVTPEESGNPMNTKHDVLAFNNAKPLRFTGATRITLDRLAKHIIMLPPIPLRATHARISRGPESCIQGARVCTYNNNWFCWSTRIHRRSQRRVQGGVRPSGNTREVTGPTCVCNHFII